MSDSQAASGGSEDGLDARQGQLGALWGGNPNGEAMGN